MNSIDELQLRHIAHPRINEHEKDPHDVIPMGRVELKEVADGEVARNAEQFQDDLLRSVKQMKRGRAARKPTVS
jgi:hypothetical protein